MRIVRTFHHVGAWCGAAVLLAACMGSGVPESGAGPEPASEVQRAWEEAGDDGDTCTYNWDCLSNHCCTHGTEHRCAACCTNNDCGGFYQCKESCEGTYWWLRGCCNSLHPYYCYSDDSCGSTCSKNCIPWK